MKENKRREPKRYRLSGISAKEIKAKYPDKIMDAYVENGRLVLVLDTCRIKFTNTEITKGAENGKTKKDRG